MCRAVEASVDKEVEDEVECACGGGAGHFVEGAKHVVHSMKGVCIGFDECEKKVIRKMTSLGAGEGEGVVKGEEWVEVLGLRKFGNEGGAKRFSGVKVLAGGVEVEEGEGGGRVCEGG